MLLVVISWEKILEMGKRTKKETAFCVNKWLESGPGIFYFLPSNPSSIFKKGVEFYFAILVQLSLVCPVEIGHLYLTYLCTYGRCVFAAVELIGDDREEGDVRKKKYQPSRDRNGV